MHKTSENKAHNNLEKISVKVTEYYIDLCAGSNDLVFLAYVLELVLRVLIWPTCAFSALTAARVYQDATTNKHE